MSILCRAFGHRVYLDDIGGAILQCCKRCNWTGRVTADFVANEQASHRIAELNRRYGVLGIATPEEVAAIYAEEPRP